MFLIGLGSSLGLAPSSFAHDGHAEDPETLVRIYRMLYAGIEASNKAGPLGMKPEELRVVQYRGDRRTNTADPVGLLLHRLLQFEAEEAARTECAHGGKCDHDHGQGHDHEVKAPKTMVTRFAQLLKRGFLAIGDHAAEIFPFFVIRIPAITVDGFQNYGTSFAIYTAATEAVEHTFVPYPAVCKLLQGFYFATAGIAFNFCRVLGSTLPDDRLTKRVSAAFLAARQEVVFKYSGFTRTITRGEPYLSQLERGDFRKYLETLNDDSRFFRSYVAATQLWGDVYASENVQPRDFFETATPGQHLVDQVDAIFDEETVKGRMWRTYRLATLLGKFSDILRDATGLQAEENLLGNDAMLALSFKPSFYFRESLKTYGRYMRVRAMLGSFSKVLERYKSSLYAVATAERIHHSDLKRLAYREFLEAHILPILAELSVLTEEDVDASRMKKIRGMIGAALKHQKEMMKTNWAFVAYCNGLLTRKVK